MTHNRHNATCERLGEMSLSQLLSLLCWWELLWINSGCSAGMWCREGRFWDHPVLFHSLSLPSWLQEMPNKLIYGLTIHKGMGKWENDPGPAGAVAAVVTFGTEKGWESCCEILVYMFGLHQKCFPLLLGAKFPVVMGL